MSEAMSLDEFLGHKTSDMGAGSNFLRWTNRPVPTVDVWLHTRAPIVSIWRHSFPRIVERKDDSGGSHNEVWGGSWNCWEGEYVLRRQYFRDREDGSRQYPPEICPFCKVIEFVRSRVEQGDIDWIEPVFKFEVGDKSDRVIHAGGLYNAFGSKNLTTEQLAELKRARIYRTETWKENAMPKCSYIFIVVENGSPESEAMVAIESASLGDKVKLAIAHRKKSKGEEAGNPILHPYAIRWEYNPKENDFNKRYDAVAMDSIPLTTEIHRLITETAPPDTRKIVSRGNPKKLRAAMEAHWCGPDIDWDEMFSAAEAEFNDSNEDPTAFPFGDDEESNPVSTSRTPSADSGSNNEDDLNASVEEDVIACDNCGADMLPMDDICKKCGAVYKPDGTFELPTKPRRSRSPVTKPASKKVVAKAAPVESEQSDWCEDDDIPF